MLLPALLALAATVVLPDEGYDLLVLDLPHRVVLGDPLRGAVRGRPLVPYVVFGDVGRRLSALRRVPIHLDLSPALFVLASGAMPMTGSRALALPTPNDPTLHGLVLHFQAFCEDPGILDRLGGSEGKAVEFLKDDGQPLVTLLTVNRIPRDVNGSEINEGPVWVPPTGFTIDLFFDERGRGGLDRSSLEVMADRALGGGAIPPNTNLAQFFTFAGASATAVVAVNLVFPAAVVNLTARIKNQNGVWSPTETFTLRSDAVRAGILPFPQRQFWLLDFDQHDLDRSGVADWREDLVLFGLGSDPRATSGPSAEVDGQARREVQATLRGHYGVGGSDPVNADFVLTQPVGTFARICVGGRNSYPLSQLPPGARETTGAAYANRNNGIKNFVICQGVLGVHPRSIFHLFQGVPAFQLVFGPLQQTPVGTHPDDAAVTAPNFDVRQATTSQRLRFLQIQAGVRAFANATAFVLAQETGHAMGLTAPGRLSGAGLLGGHAFGHSTDWHFDDGEGAFMSGNNSTPAPATEANLQLIWDHYQSGRGHWTALEWAYLRERILNQ